MHAHKIFPAQQTVHLPLLASVGMAWAFSPPPCFAERYSLKIVSFSQFLSECTCSAFASRSHLFNLDISEFTIERKISPSVGNSATRIYPFKVKSSAMEHESRILLLSHTIKSIKRTQHLSSTSAQHN